jgi:flagellar motility protein MotE (MotC chaperone)
LSGDFPAHLAAFRAGSVVAGYRLEAQVGAGGMAVVFRARDERLGRLVALKILPPALAADAAFRRRFIAEARAAAAVDDPYIIPVYEAGEADGVLFIAMRFVRGGDLRLVLDREGALPPERVVGFISPVASALDAAHGVGLVHRDVKPANILVETHPDRPEHVYLSDFGVSKGAMSSVSLTGAGNFVGTPHYSAPEQIQGGRVDGRADQYALACVAYQLLTGATPFDRDQGMAVLLAHLSQPPPSLGSLRPDLPSAADEVLARGMAKTPEKRYGSCRDFADALREALGSAPAAALPRIDIAAPSGFPGPGPAVTGHETAPAGPAPAATINGTPGGGPASGGEVLVAGAAGPGAYPETLSSSAAMDLAQKDSPSDPGSGGEVQAARRPPPRTANRTSNTTAWIRRHRVLAVAVVGVVAAAAAVVPFVLPGSPGQAHYAAIAGQQQITIATLDTETANLSQAVKRYPGLVSLSRTQETLEALTWLVRYQINDELARQAGIAVTTAQAQAALAEIYASAKASAQAQGLTNVTLDLILAANGIPPNTAAELGRYEAIQIQYLKNVNGGTTPTSTSAEAAATAKLRHAQCLAAKALNIRINPRFGRLDYVQFQIVSTSSTSSPTVGPTSTASASGLTPAC